MPHSNSKESPAFRRGESQKYLSFDGRLSGPSNDYLPTLKSLDLKNYSKKME
jgi:hypothetical protein